MTKLLLIRHGQSTANLGSFFAGHMDCPLTELGMKQAELAADYISRAYQPDAIYTSDLKRAKSVAEAVAVHTGLPVTKRKDLREIHAGAWEGVTFTVLREDFPAYQVWLTDTSRAICDGGESVVQLQERFLAAVTEIAEEHRDQTVVIVTHATPIRILQCRSEGKPFSELKNIRSVPNTSVTELHYKNGQFYLEKLGYDDYLGDMVSNFHTNV